MRKLKLMSNKVLFKVTDARSKTSQNQVKRLIVKRKSRRMTGRIRFLAKTKIRKKLSCVQMKM